MNVAAYLFSLILVADLPVLEDLFRDTAAPIYEEMQRIDKELESLAPARLTPAVPTLGYLSAYETSADTTVVVDIELRQAVRLDTVMILPVAAVDERNVARSFQFPLRFTIELIAPDGTPSIIADYSEKDYPTPGLDPQIFYCSAEAETQTIRFTALRLRKNPRETANDYFMALDEVFAFSGEWNAALNAFVKTTSAKRVPLTWNTSYLVDGFTNYAPVELDWTEPPISNLTSEDELIVTLDMGRQVVMDELRIWPIDVSSNHSHTSSQGQRFPLSLKLEIASNPGFVNAQEVFSDDHFPRPIIGPLMRAITPLPGRYVKLTAKNGYRQPGDSRTGIGFSELELFERGNLLSLGIVPKIDNWKSKIMTPAVLTDGFSKTGRIHPLKDWMLEIARRFTLEKRRAALNLSLDALHIRQLALLQWTGILFVGLIGFFAILYFVSRYRHEDRLHQMRDEIAGDLHDEVGANISSIAGTAEILQETFTAATPKQKKLFNDIIITARRTAGQTNRLIQFLERRRMDGDLILQMETTARQLLPDTHHQCSWEGAEIFNRLPSSQKWDLLLFFKESLHNIVKHSQATIVTVEGMAAKGVLILSVHDNGSGISNQIETPTHLKLRARRLKGRLTVQTGVDIGTTIRITMKIPRNPIA